MKEEQYNELCLQLHERGDIKGLSSDSVIGVKYDEVAAIYSEQQQRTIGHDLRVLRKDPSYTQRILAHIIAVHSPTVANTGTGDAQPKQSILVSEARRLHLPPCTLAREVLKCYLLQLQQQQLQQQIDHSNLNPDPTPNPIAAAAGTLLNEDTASSTSSISAVGDEGREEGECVVRNVDGMVKAWMKNPAHITLLPLRHETEQCIMHDDISSPMVPRLKK